MSRAMWNFVRCSVLVFAVAACGGGGTTDGGAGGGAGGGDGGLVPFTPPSATPVKNAFLVTVTGEESASEGLTFPPPANSGEPSFIDGWEVRFEHVVVALDHLSLSENPDLNHNDPSQTGEEVARLDGPWAIDLAKEGPLDAKEMNGTATPLARFERQNLRAGAPAFSTDSKYAFGYALIAAQPVAFDVNLDDAGRAAWREMVAKGWSVWLSGTATWKGDLGAPACRTTDASYDFGRLPKSVSFSFGFRAPVEYRNCENPELSPAGSRGVQSQADAETVTQVTLHLDHPFWEALMEDVPLRFDAIAARASVDAGPGPAVAHVTEADLAGLDFQAFRDAQGVPLPWRYCGAVTSTERTSGVVSYDPVHVPVNPAGGAAGLADLDGYMTYNLSTFGHLNNDGLCFPARQYPSPP